MYLLDTCVISDLVAKKPNPGVIRWLDETDEGFLNLSAITIGEIKKGIERLPGSYRKIELSNWLEHDLLSRFKGRILMIDVDVMLTWGRLSAGLEAAGKKMPAIDSLIAALAVHYSLQLVTRNVGDFEHAGIGVVNPWVMYRN